MTRLKIMLQKMQDLGASDLHLRSDQRPCYRINGELERAEGLLKDIGGNGAATETSGSTLHELLSILAHETG